MTLLRIMILTVLLPIAIALDVSKWSMDKLIVELGD